MHFEELWEKCEKTHQDSGAQDSVLTTMDELAMKINLYKMLDGKTDVPPDELQKVKSRTMGEILLSLTKLSLTDNINVFEALSIAQQYRSAENAIKIPKNLRLP